MQIDTLRINKKSWDEVAPRFYGRTALPEYGPFAPTEDELNLFGNVAGLRLLEIGCGSGHSIKYMHDNNAGEIWGLDLSSSQILAARDLLYQTDVHLFESSMDQIQVCLMNISIWYTRFSRWDGQRILI